jgi:hypothetical protein
MKLSEHIEKYHGGNISKFGKSIGQNTPLIHHWLNNGGYKVEEGRILKVMRVLPQSELDHIKRIDEL